MTNRIMQKEIVSDPFTALVPNTDITDTLQEFMALQQLYDAGIKEVRTKLEILDDEFKIKHDHILFIIWNIV